MYFFSGAFCAADLEAQQCWDLLDENVTTQYILEVLAKKAYSYETFAQCFLDTGFTCHGLLLDSMVLLQFQFCVFSFSCMYVCLLEKLIIQAPAVQYGKYVASTLS